MVECKSNSCIVSNDNIVNRGSKSVGTSSSDEFYCVNAVNSIDNGDVSMTEIVYRDKGV